MVGYFHYNMLLTSPDWKKQSRSGWTFLLLSGFYQYWRIKGLFFSFLFFVGRGGFGRVRLRSSRFCRCISSCLLGCFFSFGGFLYRWRVFSGNSSSNRLLALSFNCQCSLLSFRPRLCQALLLALYSCRFTFQPFVKFGSSGSFVESTLFHATQ